MANCPSCGGKLRLINVSQYCPHCGANMRFVNFEETFYREAKYAELAQANVKAKIKRFKGAFIGSKLTIARLAAAFLPVLALLIPNGGFSLKLPLLEVGADFGVMGLVSLFTGNSLSLILGMTGSELYGAGFSALRTALFSYVAVAGLAALVLVSTILCFLSVKHMQKVIAALSFIGAGAAVCSIVLIAAFAKNSAGCAMIEGSAGFGLIAAAVMFTAVGIVNIILGKKGVPVEYDEGMLERTEIYRRLRRGEVSLEDLPQPVVETAATRALEAKIAAEEENYKREMEEEAFADG